jgi:hypothetical protein
VAEVLARQGRYQQVRDNLRVKEVRLGSGDAARRFVLCHNPEQAERDRTQREQAVARLEAELERITARTASHPPPSLKRKLRGHFGIHQCVCVEVG